MSAVVGFGRRTVTGLLSGCGLHLQDWSAACRLFSKERFNKEALFHPVRAAVLGHLAPDAPLLVHMDDTLLHKCGTKIHGVAFRRDPLGPPFRVNFIRAQRFFQLSASLPFSTGLSDALTIPVDFVHAPTPPKPGKKATPELQTAYKEKCKETRLTLLASERLKNLRHWLNQQPGGQDRALWMVGDGSFCNATVLRNLPKRCLFICRTRKDAKLYHPLDPSDETGKGRPRVYGKQAPTPQGLRQDPAVPWQEVKVWAAGKEQTCKIKTLGPLLSRMTGQKVLYQLVVIAPLAYLARKGAKPLYRQPAYLLCTDPDLDPQALVQAYFRRWGIEVNHREEKQIFGVGEAQVRTPLATGQVPAFLVAVYAMLLLASYRAFGHGPIPNALPSPKWLAKTDGARPSAQKLVNHFRAEIWGRFLGLKTFSGFAVQSSSNTNPQKLLPDLASAVTQIAT